MRIAPWSTDFVLTSSYPRIETPSCAWTLMQRKWNDNLFVMIIDARMHSKDCLIQPEKQKFPDNPYSLFSKSPPRIICNNSNDVTHVLDNDTGEYEVKTYFTNCSVTNHEGQKIEFYNQNLVETLLRQGRTEDIKPQFVYPRQQYAQCLQEAISH